MNTLDESFDSINLKKGKQKYLQSNSVNTIIKRNISFLVLVDTGKTRQENIGFKFPCILKTLLLIKFWNSLHGKINFYHILNTKTSILC